MMILKRPHFPSNKLYCKIRCSNCAREERNGETTPTTSPCLKDFQAFALGEKQAAAEHAL